jgi:hypothetical protein
MQSTTTCSVVASDTVCVTLGSNFPFDRSELLFVTGVVILMLGYQFFNSVLTVNSRKYDV